MDGLASCISSACACPCVLVVQPAVVHSLQPMVRVVAALVSLFDACLVPCAVQGGPSWAAW
jgi:hypothetical protein